MANPLALSNFGGIGWMLAVLAGFIRWISFPIHWNLLKIITLALVHLISHIKQGDYFGWFGWFNPLDFLADPLDFSNFGWISAVLAGFIQWISFPIRWNLLKIIALVPSTNTFYLAPFR